MSKIGRNDPCPCGSGKKYKQCCLKAQEAQLTESQQERSHAVPKALDWLGARHGKAMQSALLDDFFGGLSEDEYARLETFDDDLYDMVMINATEWLLAEGEIKLRGQYVPIMECLLDRGGPTFSPVQRQWLEQMGTARLSLHEVVEVVPGERMRLRDLVFPELDAVWVEEKTGSAEASRLDVMAARIMRVDDHYEVSGAVYGFHRHQSLELINELRDEVAGLDPHDWQVRDITGSIIPDRWLQRLTAPRIIPDIVDATTEEPLVFVTDHYRVNDEAELESRLASQEDLEGDRSEGWVRLFRGTDGQLRASMNIDPGKKPDRIEVSYRTERYADEGRHWFESLVGSAATFIIRDFSDPKGLLSNPFPSKRAAPAQASNIPPEVMTQVINDHMRSFYADWADSPLPALDDQSPREAIETPEGLEQVKFLLHTYEHGEAAQAKQQNRQAVSFDFLWDDLGISP